MEIATKQNSFFLVCLWRTAKKYFVGYQELSSFVEVLNLRKEEYTVISEGWHQNFIQVGL